MKRSLLPLALALPVCGAVGSGFENPFGAFPTLTLTMRPSVTLAPRESAYVGVFTFRGGVAPSNDSLLIRGHRGQGQTMLDILVNHLQDEGTVRL